MAIDFNAPVISLSIEPGEGKTYQYGFHLGTDVSVARAIAVEKFHSLNDAGGWIRTVALIQCGKILDVYDGSWVSEQSWG